MKKTGYRMHRLFVVYVFIFALQGQAFRPASGRSYANVTRDKITTTITLYKKRYKRGVRDRIIVAQFLVKAVSNAILIFEHGTPLQAINFLYDFLIHYYEGDTKMRLYPGYRQDVLIMERYALTTRTVEELIATLEKAGFTVFARMLTLCRKKAEYSVKQHGLVLRILGLPDALQKLETACAADPTLIELVEFMRVHEKKTDKPIGTLKTDEELWHAKRIRISPAIRRDYLEIRKRICDLRYKHGVTPSAPVVMDHYFPLCLRFVLTHAEQGEHEAARDLMRYFLEQYYVHSFCWLSTIRTNEILQKYGVHECAMPVIKEKLRVTHPGLVALIEEYEQERQIEESAAAAEPSPKRVHRLGYTEEEMCLALTVFSGEKIP